MVPSLTFAFFANCVEVHGLPPLPDEVTEARNLDPNSCKSYYNLDL